MDPSILTKLGLTKAESRIYLALLALGNATVSDIAKRTGFHRTNIYDILEQLKEKGLVSFFKEEKTAFYKASDPECFFTFFKQMQTDLETILPDMKKMMKDKEHDVDVQIYKGRKGMRIAMMNSLKNTKVLYAFGVHGQLRQYLPEFAPTYIREMEKKGVVFKAIYTEPYKNPPKNSMIRYVPKKIGNPVATFLYNDTVFINIWHPVMIGIVIKSKDVCQSYMHHFRLLWKMATRHPPR